jgi:hypothetical protein
MTDATRLRSELARLGLSQRAAADWLREQGVHITDRDLRYMAAGRMTVPAAVWVMLASREIGVAQVR